MKIKVSEAQGRVLDRLVAMCEGVNEEAFSLYYEPADPSDYDTHLYPEFHYSSVWSQGGPIIEREYIRVTPVSGFMEWSATKMDDERLPHGGGNAPLTAAMRCYVASKLGDEVEVLEELLI